MRTSRHVSLITYPLSYHILIARRLLIGQGKEGFDKEILHTLRLAKKIYYFKDKEYQGLSKIELSEYLQEPIATYSQSHVEGERLKRELEDFLGSTNEDDRHIPEFLLCPITCDLILEPVLISSGHTYEKSELKKHFLKNGYKDPLTGEAVSATMIDNINLRQAIEDYIEK